MTKDNSDIKKAYFEELHFNNY